MATKYRFGGYVVKVWRAKEPTYSWRFSVIDLTGKEYSFGGIPNQCETKHSAIMRGWYRAKWLANGTFNQRYT